VQGQQKTDVGKDDELDVLMDTASHGVEAGRNFDAGLSQEDEMHDLECCMICESPGRPVNLCADCLAQYCANCGTEEMCRDCLDTLREVPHTPRGGGGHGGLFICEGVSP